MSRFLFAAAFGVGITCSGIALAQTSNGMNPETMAAPSPNAVTPTTMKPAPMKPDIMSANAIKPTTITSSAMKPGDTNNMSVSHAMTPAAMGGGASQ